MIYGMLSVLCVPLAHINLATMPKSWLMGAVFPRGPYLGFIAQIFFIIQLMNDSKERPLAINKNVVIKSLENFPPFSEIIIWKRSAL